MSAFNYNDNTILDYEHVPIIASANAITGTKYITKVYLVMGKSRYPIGELNGKVEEEAIKLFFGETMNQKTEKQYGQSSTLLMSRKELAPIRDRAKGFSNMSRDKRSLLGTNTEKR